MVNMKAAVSSIQERANKAHSLVLAVFYSLRYDKHHSNSTICSSPVELPDLWKPCILPHLLFYLHYISDEGQGQSRVITGRVSSEVTHCLVCCRQHNDHAVGIMLACIWMITVARGKGGHIHNHSLYTYTYTYMPIYSNIYTSVYNVSAYIYIYIYRADTQS